MMRMQILWMALGLLMAPAGAIGGRPDVDALAIYEEATQEDLYNFKVLQNLDGSERRDYLARSMAVQMLQFGAFVVERKLVKDLDIEGQRVLCYIYFNGDEVVQVFADRPDQSLVKTKIDWLRAELFPLQESFLEFRSMFRFLESEKDCVIDIPARINGD